MTHAIAILMFSPLTLWTLRGECNKVKQGSGGPREGLHLCSDGFSAKLVVSSRPCWSLSADADRLPRPPLGGLAFEAPSTGRIMNCPRVSAPGPQLLISAQRNKKQICGRSNKVSLAEEWLAKIIRRTGGRKGSRETGAQLESRSEGGCV